MSKTFVSILGGLGGMFGWGTSDFFASLSSDKIGHFKTFFWSQLVGMIFAFLLIPVFGINISIKFLFVILLIVASIFYSAAYLFFYKGFEIGNVSVVSATINLYAVFTMVFAFIFLKQRLTWWQLFAVLMIVLGVTLVSVNFKDLKGRKVKLMLGVKEALIAALLFGVFWNLSEVISEEVGWLATTLFVKIGSLLFLALFSLFKKEKLGLSKIKIKTTILVVLIGVLEAVAVVSVNYGIILGDVILVTPISSALSIITILMALIFLKEKIARTQAVGIFIALLGIILTAF